MTIKHVNFGVICPHCGQNLKGEKVVEESHPTNWRTFFYTQSDHRLAYNGPQLVAVSCLDWAEKEPA